MAADIYAELKAPLSNLVAEHGLADDPIVVSARPLTADEAIGNPEHDDYPLLVGRERMMEAVVRDAPGQAFTDMYGRYEGLLGEVLELELTNNFRRAVFVATLNAALRFTGELDDTRHCKDEGPVECAAGLREHVAAEGLSPPFALIGFQPRFAEVLSSIGELRICDMDEQHIDQQRFGALVRPPEATDEVLDGCGAAFVTGTTLVNDTIGRFLDLPMPTWFYGVTIAAAAQLLGLNRYCASGR
jgi:hypothetical protein